MLLAHRQLKFTLDTSFAVENNYSWIVWVNVEDNLGDGISHLLLKPYDEDALKLR